MPQVRRLSDFVINLIAAGEVVERPASVVKELLENALDAGALRVDVELEKGGRKSITLRDDGCGMTRHDLLLAVERHATSKIALPEDLGRIETLGFRGEALPSIASVSRMTLLTSDGKQGWKLSLSGGTVNDLVPAGRNRGTTVTVEALFFNQPARRKFLSTVATELAWIERTVTGCALAFPDTAFSLHHDGRVLFTLPQGRSREQRLRDRYGLSPQETCVQGEGLGDRTMAHLTVFPGKVWNNRRHQYILVNGRAVSCPMVSGILNDALEGPQGNPLLLCVLDLPGADVDVNAHPTKKEVRFRDPGAVRRAVLSALDTLPGRRAKQLSGIPFEMPLPRSPDSREVQTALELDMPSRAPSVPRETREDPPSWDDVVPILQVHNAYLVAASGSGLLVVDQHAAHERVVYEQVLASMEGASASGRQQLLLPEVLHLDPDERATAERHIPLILQGGFDVLLTGDTLQIHAVPQGIHQGAEAVREILHALSRGVPPSRTQQEVLAAAAACKGSVTFGQRLSREEIRYLFHSLFATSDPFHCPHGRPTLLEITLDELEKRFGR